MTELLTPSHVNAKKKREKRKKENHIKRHHYEILGYLHKENISNIFQKQKYQESEQKTPQQQ